VLKCFILVIKRLGKGLWNGEGPEYPQVVFDAIKDNPAFLELLQSNDPSQHGIWYLAWFQEFLLSIRGHQVYKDVLAKLIDFLCEEAQHERFRSTQPAVLKTAISVSRFYKSSYHQQPNVFGTRFFPVIFTGAGMATEINLTSC
jgi:senataxin